MNKTTMAVLIALWAVSHAIVLIGALAKLEHWPIASFLLTCGMLASALSYLGLGYVLYHVLIKKNNPV